MGNLSPRPSSTSRSGFEVLPRRIQSIRVSSRKLVQSRKLKPARHTSMPASIQKFRKEKRGKSENKNDIRVEIEESAESKYQEKLKLNATVPYGRPFLLRVVDTRDDPKQSEKFIYADAKDAPSGPYACKTGGVVQTSIVTFHGANGQNWNRVAPQELDHVQEGDIVSIYANTEDDGRYLQVQRGRTRLGWSSIEPGESFDGKYLQFIVRTANMEPSTANTRSIRMDDMVTLECVDRRGWFISAASNNGQIHLSSIDMGVFGVHSPELRHLVKLSGTTGNRLTEVVATDDSSGDVLSEQEKKWLQLMGKLPLEIVFNIISFTGHWVRTARLVCKAWCIAAELHVTRIRVNGEFDEMHAASQRQELLNFIKRCKNLRSLTLRNIDDLTEHDFEFMLKQCNPKLEQLIIGGCRRFSDVSIHSVTSLSKLQDLNLAATSITDESLQVVAGNMPSLKNLNLYGCTQISANGVRLVADMENLASVNVRGTEVAKRVTDVMQRQHPRLLLLTGPILPDGIY